PLRHYLLDSDNHRLLWIAGDKVAAEIGREGSGDGEFRSPCGVGVGVNTVFVADTFNHRIQVFSPDLKYRGQFGMQGDGHGQFRYPVAIARLDDWIAVADERNKRLQLWLMKETDDPATATCIRADLCRSWLSLPFGLSFNKRDQLYVTDRIQGRVLVIDFKAM